MHVGPCGASNGGSIGAPRIARASRSVTRLHGVKRLRGVARLALDELLVAGRLCGRAAAGSASSRRALAVGSCAAASGFSGVPARALGARVAAAAGERDGSSEGERDRARRARQTGTRARTGRRPSSWWRCSCSSGRRGVARRRRRRSGSRVGQRVQRRVVERAGGERGAGDRVAAVRREVARDVRRARGDRAPAWRRSRLPAGRGLVGERRLAQQRARRRSTGCRRGCRCSPRPCRSAGR